MCCELVTFEILFEIFGFEIFSVFSEIIFKELDGVTYCAASLDLYVLSSVKVFALGGTGFLSVIMLAFSLGASWFPA